MTIIPTSSEGVGHGASSVGDQASGADHPLSSAGNRVPSVGDRAPIEGRTTNVSRGGLSATLVQGLPIGTPVEVDIVLVFEGDVRSEPLRLPAKVVWCTEVDEGHQIGIAFRPLDADRADYLGLFLKYLDQGATRERTKRDLPVDDRFR